MKTFTNTNNSGFDSSVSSNKWRWYISKATTDNSNFYLREVELYN